MKGVNASKIMAIAAGAVLLGSSAIAAGVLYENVELVNPNGQPTAKIVVGSNAQISDGIAAANIAAVLANYAYKSTTLTAGLDGKCTATASGTLSGAGTCQVSNQKVTIEITVPGVLANAYQFKTYVSDTIDKTLENRMGTLSEDTYLGTGAVTTLSDTSTILSPLRGADVTASNTANLYMIGDGMYNGFAAATIKDDQATSDFSYVENQNFWIGTSNAITSAVYFESASAYRSVVAKPNIIAYNARFTGNDYGIPVCTANLAISGDWTTCAANSDRTDNHRMKIKFLGEDWVISAMTPPSNSTAAGQLTNTVGAQTGGQIKLAKEAKYDIVNVGGVIDGGDFKIRLADISTATGATNQHPAILDILDANDAVVGQIQVDTGTTYTFTQSSTGKSIKVHVYRTAPGFTLSAKWAELAIYTDEITLENAKRYNGASSDDTNWKNVFVSLLWKNRDASATSNQPDSLREIVLYVDDMSTYLGGDNRMVANGVINFPKLNPQYTLTYNGLDLTDTDYASVALSVDAQRTIGIGMNADCNTKNHSFTTNFIKVRSDTSGAFGGTTDALGNDRVDEFLLAPAGNMSMDLGVLDQTFTVAQTDVLYNWSPQIFWKPSGCTYYKYRNGTQAFDNKSMVNTTVLTAFAAATNAVKFESAGADSGAYGALRWYFVNHNATDVTVLSQLDNLTMDTRTARYPGAGLYGDTQLSGAIVGEIVIQEDAGKWNATTHYPVMIRQPVYRDATSSEYWRFKTSDSATTVTYYDGINTSSTVTPTLLKAASPYELPFVSERGTKVSSIGLSSATIYEAKRVAQPTFTFAAATASTGTATSAGELWQASVGDTKTLSNGVVLKVKSIDQTVGSCQAGTTTGAAPTCTVNMDPVSARIMPNNVASLETIVPYDIKSASSMVISDKDAGSAGGVIITVGGPIVNSVTAQTIKDAAVDFSTTNVYVKAFGSKIVVAGNTAADTMQAAQEFINALQKN